jgi:hypothetical protein
MSRIRNAGWNLLYFFIDDSDDEGPPVTADEAPQILRRTRYNRVIVFLYYFFLNLFMSLFLSTVPTW